MGIHIMPPLYEMVIKPKLGLGDYCHAVGEVKPIGYLRFYNQSFIPAKGYKISKVVLLLRRDETPLLPGRWVSFEFREAEADGKPKSVNLFTATIPWENLPYSLGQIEIPFTTDIILTPGQPYCIILGWGGTSAYGFVAYWSWNSTLACGLALWLWDQTTSPYWFLLDGSCWFEVWR